MKETDNSADLLDIRDLIERIEELRGERDPLTEAIDDAQTDFTFTSHGDGALSGQLATTLDTAQRALHDWNDSDEASELRSLESFVAEMKGYGGDEQWEGHWYPVTLVRDTYWEDFARDEAEAFHGEAVTEARWPFNCIDWERAARELQADYSSADFDGVTYWYR